ncbi:Spi family protease inhibitor [Pedobacter insulae]|uniref:Spi protease inhibitor n=1 Tax=Pedobacter insulae TaxID=414048 RepID=A0A1I2W3P4_9SPHI|nr:Spi family protease inhibitor [Pedobacter insulae]SFG95269.1 Spi protease inhibitor [Pedobacter insulae]
MKKTHYLILFMLPCFFGCKKVDYLRNPPIELSKIDNHIVTIVQANKIALLHAAFPQPVKKPSRIMNLGEPIKSSVQMPNPLKTIKSTFPYNDSDSDPTLFIINFVEGGFVIVGGDDRIRPILAHSDKTSFPTDEEYPLQSQIG